MACVVNRVLAGSLFAAIAASTKDAASMIFAVKEMAISALRA